jgi:hypothetical protein
MMLWVGDVPMLYATATLCHLKIHNVREIRYRQVPAIAATIVLHLAKVCYVSKKMRHLVSVNTVLLPQGECCCHLQGP